MSVGSLLATSDLHISYDQNRAITETIRPTSDEDWLIVAGDVAESVDRISWALELLSKRFAKVIWAPGNHELWTTKHDSVQLRGQARYEHLVRVCRELGVSTPEDEFPIWRTEEEEFVVAPLFVLYDYSFREPGATLEATMKYAYETGIVCTDELVLHPDPHPTRQAWCHERVEITRKRLDAIPEHLRTVLVSHWPLHRGPTTMLRWPHFAMWCGTELTADWHLRYRAAAAVYGHLHIPLTLEYDGVRFEEVSLGYPREWSKRTDKPYPVRSILPADPTRVPWNRRDEARA
ncbi:metallophosphoesterase family protein [Kutzneria albida]|uniref:SimX4-like protein n=1 Tax=Kutzneria albida DSM 43870 TaxID=1449976 RepID=W5WFE3_9PSEU|nr:metallophosphoesterase [Kutzneria albida]AHH96884.1 SimX4-like protein [Kutzneria albida DSM 43870]